MPKKHPHRRFRFKLLVFAAFLIAAAIAFHRPLVLLGCKAGLHRFFAKDGMGKVFYEKLEWENNILVLSGLQVSDEAMQLSVDRIEVIPKFYKMQFQPKITLLHPQIVLSASHHRPLSTREGLFIVQSRFFSPRFEIKNGVLAFGDGKRFFFKMSPGDGTDSIGEFAVSSDPDPMVPPIFLASLKSVGRDFQLDFRLQECDLSRLAPLSAIMLKEIPRNWERATGEIQLEGALFFGPSLEMKGFHCCGEGKDVELFSSKIGIDLKCDEFQGDMSFSSLDDSRFWAEALSASFYLKNGMGIVSSPLVNETLEFEALDANFLIGPGMDPELSVKGKILAQNQSYAFSCVGKGGMHPDETFWSEFELFSSSSLLQKTRAVASLCSYPDKDFSLHLEVEDADASHIELVRSLCQIPGKCLGGNLTFGATWLATKGNWHQATFEHCLGNNIQWGFPEMQMTWTAKKIIAESTLVKKENAEWTLEDLHVESDGGQYTSSLLQLDAIALNFTVEGGILQPSQLKLALEGLETEIELLGDSADHLADIKIKGDGKEAFELLFSKKIESFPITLEIAVHQGKEELILNGEGTLSDEPISAVAAFMASTTSWKDIIWGKRPTFDFKEISFNAEHMTEKSYGKLAALFVPEITLAGELKCEGNLKSSGVEISIGGKDILMEHPLAQLYLPKTEGMRFVYQGKWQGEIPLDQGKLKYREADLLFDNLEGRLKIDGGHVTAPGFYAEVEGLAVRGDMNLAEGQLTLTTSQVAGTVPHLFSVLRRFPFFPKGEMPIEGSFYCEKEGFVLRAVLEGKSEPEVRFKGYFQGLQFPINSVTSFSDGNCEISFNTQDNRLVMEKGEGKWKLIDGTPLSISLKRLSADKKNFDFAMKVCEGKKEWALLEGNAALNSASQWEIAFQNPATSFDGTALNVQRCLLDPQLKLTSFKASPTLKCRNIPAWASLLKNAGFLPQTFSVQSLIDLQCDGSMETEVFSENVSKGFSIHARSRDFCVRGKPLPGFQFKATRRGETWHIEQLESADLSLKGKIEDTGSELCCKDFDGKWQGIEWKGSGKVKTAQKKFSCQLDAVKGDLTTVGLPWKGTFAASATLSGDYSDPNDPLQLSGEANVAADVLAPIRLTAKNKKAARFTYNNASGLICQGADLQIKDKQTGEILADLRAEKIEREKIEKLQFSLTRTMIDRCVEAKFLHPFLKDLKWEGRLDGEGDLQIAPKTMFQAAMKPGSYGIGKYDLPFEQLQIKYEKDLVDVRGKTKINEQPLWTVLQTNIAKEPYGAVKFLDNPKAEGLKCSFTSQNGGLVWDSMQGSCYGLQCQLNKSGRRKIPFASVLSGTVKLNGNSLRPLLPKEIGEAAESFQFGDGYEWQGDLVVFQEAQKGFQLSGALSGNSFEILGYRFQKMQGNLEAASDRLAITDLKIEDPSGAIGIKKIALDKQAEWDLYIPQIVIRNLQPSLMQKIDGNVKTVKPFTIKNGILSEIRGKLGDKSTLEGVGKLAFNNQFKKESSLFDIPIDFIKNIGLDPGLLTPIQGELELELRGDKFYLLTLSKAFSEGGRTEFYLASRGKEPSYIDLSGKMHIDLKMHQDVMLKITEPFTLTIRGTLEKPRYGLQH